MSCVLVDVKRPRKAYPPGDDAAVAARMKPLSWYIESARRLIGRYAPEASRAALLASEDAVAFVAYKVMMGDWDYDESLGVKLSTYRVYRARCAIGVYLKLMARAVRPWSLDHLGDDDDWHDKLADPRAVAADAVHARSEEEAERLRYVEFLLNDLSDQERACVILHYIDGLQAPAIAEALGVPTRVATRDLRRGIEGLRRAAGAA